MDGWAARYREAKPLSWSAPRHAVATHQATASTDWARTWAWDGREQGRVGLPATPSFTYGEGTYVRVDGRLQDRGFADPVHRRQPNPPSCEGYAPGVPHLKLRRDAGSNAALPLRRSGPGFSRAELRGTAHPRNPQRATPSPQTLRSAPGATWRRTSTPDAPLPCSPSRHTASPLTIGVMLGHHVSRPLREIGIARG